jgi:hypothetical protein
MVVRNAIAGPGKKISWEMTWQRHPAAVNRSGKMPLPHEFTTVIKIECRLRSRGTAANQNYHYRNVCIDLLSMNPWWRQIHPSRNGRK